MSEKQKTETKTEKGEKAAKKFEQKEEVHDVLVRILGYDLPGSKNIYSGLTRIKGVSWGISNAACIKLNISRNKKVSELSKEEIQKIESFLRNLAIYDFMKNRRNDLESGKTIHLYGSDLDIRREFDIKRLKEIKSYRGIRHSLKQPVRGQRTRSHFRKRGAAMGVKKKKK